MKKIEDYFKNKDLEVKYLDGYDIRINRELLLEIIKEIRIDTINETCQACADNADAKMQTLTEIFKAKDTKDWLGYNRLFESNLRKTSI